MAAGTGGDYLYQLVLSSGGYGGDDTRPSVDPKLVQQWREMKNAVSDYRLKRDKAASVERMADLKARLEYIKSGRDTVAKLEETVGKDRRVSAQVFKDMQVALMRNRTELANKSAQFQSRVFTPAAAAFDSAGGGAAGVTAMSDALLNTLTAEGVGYNPQDPSVGGLAEQYAERAFSKPLMQLTESEVKAKIQAGGGSSELQARAAEFVRNGRQAVVAARGAEALLNEQQKRINSIGVGHGGFIEGDSVDQLVDATKKAQAAFESLAGRNTETLSAEIESLAADDSRYRQLLADEQELHDKVFLPGAEGLRTRMGKFIANPDVRAWAEAYGYKVGQSTVDSNGKVSYLPGPDDEKVLMRFSYQATHPEEFGRLFMNQGATRDLVRITATDPEARDKLLKDNDLGGGTYAVEKNGAILSPEDYAQKLIDGGFRSGGYQYVKQEGKMYVKSASGALYTYDKISKKFTPAESALPEGLEFKDAAVFGADGKPQRYLTGTDIANGIGVSQLGYADPQEAGTIQAQKPRTVEIRNADQIPAGAVEFEGYLDKPNAGMMAQYGSGAVSINNGQHVFTKGVKVEVLRKDAEREKKSPMEEKARREAAKLGTGGQLTRAELSSVRPESPAPVVRAPPQPTDLAYDAALDPTNADSRLAMLVDAALITPEQAAEARRRVEEARLQEPPAAEPQTFTGQGDYTYRLNRDNTVDVIGGPPSSRATPTNPIKLAADVAEKALKERAASAKAESDAKAKAEPPEALFVRTSEGAVYEIGRSYARMLRPAPNAVLDKNLLVASGPEYNALVDKLRATPPTLLTKGEADSMRPPKPATPPAPATPAGPKITTRAGSVRVDYHNVRPTLREQAKEALGKLFAKPAPPRRDVPPPTPDAAAALSEASDVAQEADTAPVAPAPVASASLGPLSVFKQLQKAGVKKPSLAEPPADTTRVA
jgi:hypothetical protein